MSIIDKTFTGSVNFIQKYFVPIMEKRLPGYAVPNPEFVERIQAMGLRSERMYLGAMVHEPSRSEIVMDDIAASPPLEVIECGAGNSTAWLLALGSRYGFGVTSLENHPDTIRYIQYLLDETHLSENFHMNTYGFTRFRKPDGSSYWWYDLDLAKLDKLFDFVGWTNEFNSGAHWRTLSALGLSCTRRQNLC